MAVIIFGSATDLIVVGSPEFFDNLVGFLDFLGAFMIFDKLSL
jgi:hypothetical protein